MTALLAAALFAAIQSVGCVRCKGESTLPCTKHPKGAIEAEAGASFCSIAARCALCLGTFRVDCPDCHGEKEVEHEQALNAVRKKLDEQKAFEKEMGGEARARVVTDGFDLTFEVENLTVGRVQLDQHQLLHLYAQRLEKLYAMFNELFGLTGSDHQCKRYRVMIWRNPLDVKESSNRYTQVSSANGAKLLGGARCVYVTLHDKSKKPSDDDLHRSVVHNVVHLFLSDLYAGIWIGQFKAGWADEGLSHWFEDKLFEKCDNYCYQEQNTNVDFRGGKWRVPVRSMVESGKHPSFSETSQKTGTELTTQEHALAFSFVDFLIARDAKPYPAMVKIFQKRRPTREALQDSYGLSMAEFEREWKKWVLETYQKR